MFDDAGRVRGAAAVQTQIKRAALITANVEAIILRSWRREPTLQMVRDRIGNGLRRLKRGQDAFVLGDRVRK